MLGLQHPWERTLQFYQGSTDWFMDYGHNADNKQDGTVAKKVRFSKADWDAVREGKVQTL